MKRSGNAWPICASFPPASIKAHQKDAERVGRAENTDALPISGLNRSEECHGSGAQSQTIPVGNQR